MKNVRNFFNQTLLTVLLLLAIIDISQTFLPSRKDVLDFFNASGTLLDFIQLIAFFLHIMLYGFFYGWITNLILLLRNNEKVSLRDSLQEIKHWYPRSIIALTIGQTVLVATNLLLLGMNSLNILSSFPYMSLTIFASGIWLTLTYTLYPTLIADRNPLWQSVKNSFAISVKSAPKWFHWFLLLFIFSGSLTFVWLPNSWAERTVGESPYSGWLYHVIWLGGYSFKNYWYSDLTYWLKLSSPMILTIPIFCLNILVATAIKIKVTQVLFEYGYLNENHSKDENSVNNISPIKELKSLPTVLSSDFAENCRPGKNDFVEDVFQRRRR